jgi:hypothetical protein
MHGITQYDSHVGTERAWHGLTRVEGMIFFQNSGLDWEVMPYPIFNEDMNQIGDLQLNKNGELISKPFKEIRAGDVTIAITKESYATIQNERIFRVIQPLVDEYGFKIVSAGSIFARKRVFLTLEASDSDFSIGDDKHLLRLNCVSSHDGSLKTQFYNSNVRIVCSNTLRFSMTDLKALKAKQEEEGEQSIYFDFAKHTSNAESRLEKIKESLITFYNAKLEMVNIYSGFQDVAVNAGEAKAITLGMLNGNADKPSTQAINKSEEISNLFANGIGNSGKTLYDLFNGVTEYYTRHASDNVEKLWLSSEFGSYANLKNEAFQLFQNQDEVEKMLKKGNELLALV